MKIDNLAIFSKLDPKLEEFLVDKAPCLPINFKESVVNFFPWAVILGILLIPFSFLSFLGVIALPSHYFYSLKVLGGINYFLTIIFLVILELLGIFSLPGLAKKNRQGWHLIWLAVLAYAVYNLLTLDLIGFLMTGLVGFYLLYQVREYYQD